MNIQKKVILLGAIFALSLMAQITDNVHFKDLKGKEYDLFDLLSKGKYLVIHTQYNS